MVPPDLTRLSDEELVRLVVESGARDDRPFAEIFRRYHRKVWSLCHRYFPDKEEADDLAQDAFLRAYRGLRRFQGRSAFGSWLYRVTMNTCHNEYRRRSRRPQETDEEVSPREISTPASAPARLELEDDLESLANAMATLRPEERQILELIDLEEISYQDAARTLRIGLSAAKMRAQRARLALRSRLDSQPPDSRKSSPP